MPIASWGIDEDKPRKGPWFSAKYPGETSCCGSDISTGDDIRADGNGGWEGRCCFELEEDTPLPKLKGKWAQEVICPECFIKARPGSCNCDKEKQ